MFSLAIVDDEAELLYSLKIILSAEGWNVSVFSDSQSALAAFEEKLPDLAVMDIIMPGKDGLWLCRKLRELSGAIPIIFLSAKMDEMDRIVGLESGADDYLCKPFSTQELIARIKVQKRRLDYLDRKDADESPSLSLDGFCLNRNKMSLSLGSSKTALTFSEYSIMELLMRRRGSICSRDELLHAVYPRDIYVSDRVIDNHIKRIRDKIRLIGGEELIIIETVYGIGYRWYGD